MHLLTAIQELQMVDALVQLDKWPREKADYVVLQVSHGIDASYGNLWGELNDLLKTLRDQKIITALQSLQVRHYLNALDRKRELRPDLRAPPQITLSNPYFIASALAAGLPHTTR